MTSELILKYLTQECTEQELVIINEWLGEKKDNQQWLFELKILWDKRNILDLSRQEYLDKQFNATLQKITESGKERTSSRYMFRHMKRITAWVAAACLFVFIVNTTITKNSFFRTTSYVVEHVSSDDSIRRIILPDHSIVWLGANSEIKYLPKFDKAERRVILSGEAYFDVRKEPNRPFRVETSDFTVKVLGTRFNVSSYNTHQTTNTTLFSGKVIIENSNQQELLILTPGQKVSYSKANKQMLVENIVLENSSILSESKYITFNEATLESIIRKLQYSYGINIVIMGELNNDTSTYTGSILRKDSLEAVLRGLQHVVPFSFENKTKGNFVLKKKS